MKKQYTMNVEVTEERSLQVVLTSDKKPTKADVKEALNNHEYDDVIDEETLKVVSVDSVEITEVLDADSNDEE